MIKLYRIWKAARADAKADRKHKENADMLNGNYGGDWYFDHVDKVYRDAHTTRTATVR